LFFIKCLLGHAETMAAGAVVCWLVLQTLAPHAAGCAILSAGTITTPAQPQPKWSGRPSSTYYRGETSMFGSASGLQICIYNKTEQARDGQARLLGKVWRTTDNPFDDADQGNYDAAKPVTRIELRFHHSIVQQFSLGSLNVHTGQAIGGHTYAALVPHLDGLWRYGCEAFRLLDRPVTYNAFWTLISQDVRVSLPVVSLIDHATYKRHYKTARGFSGKNVDLFIGNMVSLLARERVGAKKAFASLKEWDCWPVIRDHYAAKGKTENGIYQHIKDLLQERIIRWGRAV
jgi:hypothetical protein